MIDHVIHDWPCNFTKSQEEEEEEEEEEEQQQQQQQQLTNFKDRETDLRSKTFKN